VPVPSSDPTAADLLARCLRAAGVRRAFRADGSTLPTLAGIEVLDVGDPAVASLLADADGRLATGAGARPGLALLPGRRLRLSSSPGEEVLALPVLSADVVPSAVAGWTLEAVHAAVELEIDDDFDLGAPAPPQLEPLALDASSAPLVRLSPSLAEVSIVLVVGPGVVRDGQVDGVAEAARRTGARVVATPGALGVLPLDDPAWSGVVGLQADDARLAGVVDAELLVLVGIDPAEAVAVVPPDAQVLEVEPWHLAFMAHTWPDPEPDLEDGDAERRGRLVDGLDAVARAGRTSDAVPLHPVRALADLFDVVELGALVLADAGPAGLWLARGVRARPAGSAVVPARDVPGFAVAGAMVAGLDRRPAVALLADPVDPMSEALLDIAARLGIELTCVVWGGEAEWSEASEHRERLVGARHEGGVQRLAVPVDLTATQELLDLAGPVVAWSADPLDAALGGG
jgi:thiamine pyrophosphate-dependent acetolactate synthase large subunit-like protein